VVPAVRCIRSFCERKLIHSHPNNSRHPFFQPNCRRIMIMPMNVKEFDNFFGDHADQLAIFRPNFVQNCEFRFSVQNAKFRDFVRFSSKTNLLCPYTSVVINYRSELPYYMQILTRWRVAQWLKRNAAPAILETAFVHYLDRDICLFNSAAQD